MGVGGRGMGRGGGKLQVTTDIEIIDPCLFSRCSWVIFVVSSHVHATASLHVGLSVGRLHVDAK